MKWGRSKDGGAAKPTGVGGVSFDSGEDDVQAGTVEGVDAPVEPENAWVDPDADTGGVRTLDMSDEAAVAAAAEPTPASRKGMFGKGAAKAKPVIEAKPVKEARVKQVKVKPEKAARVKRAEEEPSLPITVVIDFYLGITKEREAEQLIRAQIEKNFDAPNASYLYIQRWRDGIAVEMQEGGGKAYLPEVLAKLDEDPTALVAVAMSNRFAQVRLDPDTKSLETLLLVANQEPPESAFIALPTRPMRPYDRRGSKVFMSGVALLAATSMAMLFSLGAFFIDTDAWAIPYIQQTPVKDLPMAQTQTQKVTSLIQGGAECIFKMEYTGGVWNVVAGHDGGGSCVEGAAPVASPMVPDAGVPPISADGTSTVPPTATPGVPVLGASAPPVAPMTGAGAAPTSPTAPPVFAAPAGAPPSVTAAPGR
jgi:hypothetical protein